jgi:ABC-type sulfate transport system permease subunit
MSVVLGTLRPSSASKRARHLRDSRREPLLVGWILTAIAVTFLVVFLVLPLATVFHQA